MYNARLCSKKNWWEPSALNLWNPVCPAYMIPMKNLRFLVAQEQKLGATGHRALLEHTHACLTCTNYGIPKFNINPGGHTPAFDQYLF